MSKSVGLDLVIEKNVLLETYEDGTYLLETSLFTIEREMENPHLELTANGPHFCPEEGLSILVSDKQREQLRQFYPMLDAF